MVEAQDLVAQVPDPFPVAGVGGFLGLVEEALDAVEDALGSHDGGILPRWSA